MSKNQDFILKLHQNLTDKFSLWVESNGEEVMFYEAVERTAGQPDIGAIGEVEKLPNPFSNPRPDLKTRYNTGRTILAVVMKLNDPYLSGLDQYGDIAQLSTKEDHDPRIVFTREYQPQYSVIERSFTERNVKTGLYEPKAERLLRVRAEPYGEKPNIQVVYYMIPFFNEIIEVP